MEKNELLPRPEVYKEFDRLRTMAFSLCAETSLVIAKCAQDHCIEGMQTLNNLLIHVTDFISEYDARY